MKYTAPKWLSNASLYGRKIPITVIGLGGTGTELASRLYKMDMLLRKLGGEGLDVTFIDDDTVSAANIGRQAFYNFDLGLPKAQVIAERFNNYSDSDWKYRIERFTSKSMLPDSTIIISCVDNPQSRLEIQKCLERHYHSTIWIDGGNDSNTAQVVMGTFENRSDLPYQRLPTVVDLYGQQLRTQKHVVEDSCSHEDAIAKQDFGINDTVAHAMAQLIWQLVRYGETKAHGAIIDMLNFSQSPLPIDPDVWAMYGFDMQALVS